VEGRSGALDTARASVEAAPILAASVVGFCEGAALFLVVLSVGLEAVGHTEHIEDFLYLAAFAGILPASFLTALRRAGRLAEKELTTLAALDALGLVVALTVARLTGTLTPVLLIGGLALLIANEALSGPLKPALSSRPAQRLPLHSAVAPLALAAVLPFVPPSVFSSGRFSFSLVVASALAAVWTFLRFRRWIPFWIVDGLAVVLIASLIFDDFWWAGYFNWGGLQLDNQNFYLGPTNEILHGRTLLVDMFSQYGVGVIYFLGGFFAFVPIGYGTFSMLVSALYALEILALYAVVRLATRSQVVAILATAVAIVFVIFGQLYTLVLFPSSGALRFGPPFAVLLLEVLAARAGARRQTLQAASAVVTALLSLWSFETFAYALVAYLAIVVLEAAAERGRAREVLWRRLSPLVLTVLVVHVVFAVATRAAAGSWPAWRTYLDYLPVLHSVGGYFTLPVPPWSPAFVLAAACFASALLLALLVARGPELVRERRELFVGIAGSTAFAILAFTYYVGRSHPNNLHHIAPPAIAMCALWAAMLDDIRLRRLPLLRAGLIALALWAGLMLASGSWHDAQAKWSRTALGTLVSRSPSTLVDRVRFLARRPAVDPRAPEAALLLRALDPGASRSLVLVDPELTTEVLLRAGRGNALPIATPFEDVALKSGLQRVLSAVPRLGSGTTMLTNASYLAAPLGSDPNAGLTEWAFWDVRRYFVLQTLARTPDGLVLLRLGARRTP
jgi:hypothetical protein